MIFGQKWKWLPFIGFQLLAILLVYSYINDNSYLLWRGLDERFFFLLNGSLRTEPGYWEAFWAYSSTRAWDLVSAFLILAFFVFNKNSHEGRSNLMAFLILLLLLMLFRENIFVYLMDIIGKVKSPSLVLPDVIRLSEMFPAVELKDKSKISFPGDHASVTFLWCWLMWRWKLPLWVKLTALALTILLISPRLISGAHWLSDVLVGGGSLAIIVAAWSFYTPGPQKLLDILNPTYQRFILWLGKVTGMRHILPFFRA